MSSAAPLKRQQPKFMAVKTEKKKSEHFVVNKQKRKINKGILSTWIALIVLTILFWYFIFKMFM
jgi:hypothetical protein